MKIKALDQRFGSNRMYASNVGKEIGKVDYCVVPFCGGCPELPHIKCRSGVACDKHSHIINLARVIRTSAVDELERLLEDMLFHERELHDAQERCIARETRSPSAPADVPGQMFITGGSAGPAEFAATGNAPDVQWAADYAACSWMTRGGGMGTKSEFTSGLSFRWNAGGGDSCKRFRSFVESLKAWHKQLATWNFIEMDALLALEVCLEKDRIEQAKPASKKEKRAVYVDAPWPGPGDAYKHRFGEDKQIQLAELLGRFVDTRVVIRFGVHPLIEKLYPRDKWNWVEQTTRTQANGDCIEVLILNGDSYVQPDKRRNGGVP